MSDANPPLLVAIVGAGPSGFFCADYLLRLAQPCTVSMFEQWPCPYGLIRGAVAPDHPNIRLATRAFDRIAAYPGFDYYGNVRLGRDIRLDELRTHYDAVIIATGAAQSRELGVPGEELPGCHDAVTLAGWSNARLDCAAMQPNLGTPSAVVIGAGNAALDMVRLFITPPDGFEHTDMSEIALWALHDSQIRDVHLVSRRGPLDAKYPPNELALLGQMSDVDIIFHDHGTEASGSGDVPAHPLQPVYERLRLSGGNRNTASRRIHFHFGWHVQAILGNAHVEGVLLVDGVEHYLHIPCGLVVKAIGNRGVPLDELPFDEASGVIPNDHGRVWAAAPGRGGVYVAGWIKRGAVGVLGANKPDCRETVQCILEDRALLTDHGPRDSSALYYMLASRNLTPVSYAQWKAIDAEESRRGAARGKLRERFCSVEEMLDAVEGNSQ